MVTDELVTGASSDAIFTLQRIKEKHPEFNKLTHTAIIHFVNAFDNNVERGWVT